MSGSADEFRIEGELASPTVDFNPLSPSLYPFLPSPPLFSSTKDVAPFSPSFARFIEISGNASQLPTSSNATTEAPSTGLAVGLGMSIPSDNVSAPPLGDGLDGMICPLDPLRQDADLTNAVINGPVEEYLYGNGKLDTVAAATKTSPYLCQPAPVFQTVEPFATNRVLGSPLRVDRAIAPNVTTYNGTGPQNATLSLWSATADGRRESWLNSATSTNAYLANTVPSANPADLAGCQYPTTASQSMTTPYSPTRADREWNAMAYSTSAINQPEDYVDSNGQEWQDQFIDSILNGQYTYDMSNASLTDPQQSAYTADPQQSLYPIVSAPVGVPRGSNFDSAYYGGLDLSSYLALDPNLSYASAASYYALQAEMYSAAAGDDVTALYAAPQATVCNSTDVSLQGLRITLGSTTVNPDSLLLTQRVALTGPVAHSNDSEEYARLTAGHSDTLLTSYPDEYARLEAVNNNNSLSSYSIEYSESDTGVQPSPNVNTVMPSMPADPNWVPDFNFDLNNEKDARADAMPTTSNSQHKTYRAERPQRPSDKPWVRLNHTTQGKSTRTGKINHYDPSSDGRYQQVTTPFANGWSSRTTGTDFSYNQWGELEQIPADGSYPVNTFTAAQLKSFIMDHPTKGNNAKLTLWIQRTPADSAKRYPTVQGPRCRFHECPGAVHNRNIGVGLFRVACDERWSTTGAKSDPFVVAGYVHLYCMERFLDFAEICKHVDVRADDRVLPSEPRGKFGAALEDSEYVIAHNFIVACKQSMLLGTNPPYPVHDESSMGAAKQHDKTLTYALTKAKNATVTKSKRAMLVERGLKASHILVHMGDLDMQVKARESEKKRKRAEPQTRGPRTKRAKRAVDDEDDDESEAEAPRPKRNKTAAIAAPKAVAGKKRSRDEDSDDDNASLFDDSDTEAPAKEPSPKRQKAAAVEAPKVVASKKRDREEVNDDEADSLFDDSGDDADYVPEKKVKDKSGGRSPKRTKSC